MDMISATLYGHEYCYSTISNSAKIANCLFIASLKFSVRVAASFDRVELFSNGTQLVIISLESKIIYCGNGGSNVEYKKNILVNL